MSAPVASSALSGDDDEKRLTVSNIDPTGTREENIPVAAPRALGCSLGAYCIYCSDVCLYWTIRRVLLIFMCETRIMSVIIEFELQYIYYSLNSSSPPRP